MSEHHKLKPGAFLILILIAAAAFALTAQAAAPSGVNPAPVAAVTAPPPSAAPTPSPEPTPEPTPTPAPTPTPRTVGFVWKEPPAKTDSYLPEAIDGQKTVYLTFDDGPSTTVTPKILATLKKYKVHATFFPIGMYAAAYPDLLKEEYADGNALGNHSYTHNYSALYNGVDGFMDEIGRAEKNLNDILGFDYNTPILRFPGGSANPDNSRQIYKDAAVKAGYKYVDWNASTADAADPPATEAQILGNAKNYIGRSSVVLLMHDAAAKKPTAAALPQIIEAYQKAGYVFGTLN